MAAAPFYFQMLLGGWEGAPPDAVNRSVVVEVYSGMVSLASVSGEKEKTERQLTEEAARRIATELFQREFGSASEPTNSIAQIGSLPEEIRDKPPAIQRSGIRAWLI
jgi:hypothetical protein